MSENVIALAPDATDAPPPDHTGKSCALCPDKTPFEISTAARAWTNEETSEQFAAHELCFWRTQAQGLAKVHHEQIEQLKNQHQLIACLIAAHGGTMVVTPAAIGVASDRGFNFLRIDLHKRVRHPNGRTESVPDGRTRFELGPKLADETAAATGS